MVSEADLVLLHAPSVYDFRKVEKYYGPISDVVPSAPIFDMYPAGFLSLASYLGRRGYDVRIVNLAALMIVKKKLDVEKFLSKIYAEVYAIDLHWLVHAHGALEVAKLVKSLHDRPVVLGGLSATYYWHEVMDKCPYVDYVLLGDTTELPMEVFLDKMSRGGDLGEVPNLVYRANGSVKTTGLSFIPDNLDKYIVDYDWLFSRYSKRSLVLACLPWGDFLRRPIGAVISFKGCTYNCAFCGGSRYAYERFYGRRRLGVKSPEAIIREVRGILENVKIPVFFVGDLRLLGKRSREVLRLLREEGVDGEFMFEFFRPAGREFLEELCKAAPDAIIQISPDSPHEDIRKLAGRPYGNAELRSFIRNVVSMGFKRLDLYFMIGLNGQRRGEGEDIVRLVDSLTEGLDVKGRLAVFAAPLAPFLDPGSIAFENSPDSGYRLYARHLYEHRDLLLRPTWWETLNYETETMSRKDIALETYDSALRLARAGVKWGLNSAKDVERIERGVKEAEEIVLGRKKPRLMLGEEILDKNKLYPSRVLFTAIRLKLLLRLLRGFFS